MVITGVFFQGHANIRSIGYPARGGAWQGQDNIRPTGYPLEGGTHDDREAGHGDSP